ncbi:hypothetical protein CS022_24305 [Veronia nyctiphanis]|uniref:Uncharacterized protein n=1 Tax=Veronia nyctiphanis TaxID=1278244 RepID=A0A4Q0YEI8_9GAMM|nr:hypothetical protein [Veronia nyctiphanis]RXJ68054.1 hypothetical protein CS022_24305 [Veronia nyctiphanis]
MRGVSGLLSTAAQGPSDFISNLSAAAVYDTIGVPATSKTTALSAFLSVAGYAKAGVPGTFGGIGRDRKNPVGKGSVSSYTKPIASGPGWFDVFSVTNNKTGESVPLPQRKKVLVFGSPVTNSQPNENKPNEEDRNPYPKGQLVHGMVAIN